MCDLPRLADRQDVGCGLDGERKIGWGVGWFSVRCPYRSHERCVFEAKQDGPLGYFQELPHVATKNIYLLVFGHIIGVENKLERIWPMKRNV